jgi:hypothetical protein
MSLGRIRNAHSVAKGGKRADLGGQFFRSRSEANYARYLNLLKRNGQIVGWAYEPHTFVFEGIKRGTMSYTPDFRVDYPDGTHAWIEVKGWMDATSKTRLARMAKYHPAEKVVVISSKWFSQAHKNGLAEVIPGWERG